MTHESPARPHPGATAVTHQPRILEAAGYLGQCRRKGRSFAVLTGVDTAALKLAIDRFIAELPAGCRVARVLAPTDSSHAFLEAILAQLGFEPFESTADDLLRLLTVVLRQGSGQQATSIIIAEDAQDFGPRVFETIRELVRNSRDTTPAPLFVLAGHVSLNRVLDSAGMASVAALTRGRFDMARAPCTSPAPQTQLTPTMRPGEAVSVGHEPPVLELSLNHDVVGRFPLNRDRLLIGRSQHCDICIASRFVSRQHALLVRNPDGDWLIDLKSTNGTSVNSQQVTNRRLDHGDVISVGNHRLRYENPAARPLEAAARPTRDQLSETMVMRSLRGLREITPDPNADGSASSAA